MASDVLGANITLRNVLPAKLIEPARKRRDQGATVIQIQNWIKAGGPKRHGCGRSLWLQITPTGTASWVLRYRFAGKAKSTGLGACDLSGKAGLTLAQARARADDALALLRQGTDPADAKQAARAQQQASAAAKVAAAPRAPVITFQGVAHDLIAARSDGWRNRKSEAQWWATLSKYVFPIIGDKAPADVTVDDVLAILKQPTESRTGKKGPLWTAKPETASRVRGRIETVLSAAKARKLRTGENVAGWHDNLSLLLAPKGKVATVRHHPALP